MYILKCHVCEKKGYWKKKYKKTEKKRIELKTKKRVLKKKKNVEEKYLKIKEKQKKYQEGTCSWIWKKKIWHEFSSYLGAMSLFVTLTCISTISFL